MVIILAILFIVILIFFWSFYLKYINTEKKLKEISMILDDIEKGNVYHKILIDPDHKLAKICFQMNGIVEKNIEQLSELKRKEKSNKELLTNLSHDLRTPLASLIGYLEAVDEGYVEGKKKDEYIKVAKNKSYDLKKSIDTIFEWFKLDSKEKTFTFEKTDINEFTRTIIVDWIPIFEQNSIRYNICIEDEELYISIDIKAYSRIINNLIQNVISHSGADFIEMSIIDNDKYINVRVSDNGKGIPEKDLPYIFDRLYRCDKSRRFSGSGLGLSITKALVEAHNGKIHVSSIKDKKTNFCITLPKMTH